MIKPYRFSTLYGLALLAAFASPAAEEPTPEAAPESEAAAQPRSPPLRPSLEAQYAAGLRGDIHIASEVVELEAGGDRVLALAREQTKGEGQGGVILLHDLGRHADWAGVVGPLRRALPAFGWDTLSLQLPSGGTPAALLDPSLARLGAAVEHLAAQGVHNVALVGHGYGALVAANYMAEAPPRVRALVVISMPTFADDPRLDAAALLEKIQRPMLDVYGGADRPGVVADAAARAAAGRKAHEQSTGAFSRTAPARRQPPGYRQLELPGVRQGFNGAEAELVRRVRGWLDRHAPGMRVGQ